MLEFLSLKDSTRRLNLKKQSSANWSNSYLNWGTISRLLLAKNGFVSGPNGTVSICCSSIGVFDLLSS